MIYHLEGSLASSAHTGGLRYADVFPPPPACPAPGGMDLGVGVTSYSYVFAFDTSQLRGGHRLRPGGQATVIRQVFALSELGLVSTANSPGSGSQTSLIPSSCTSTWTSHSLSSLLLADFIIPADCSSWELRLHQPTALGGQTSPWRPAADVISPCSLMLTYLFTHVFGTLAPLGQASKFIILLRLNRQWTSFSAYAVTFPNVEVRCYYGRLYVHDLPLRLVSTTFLQPASTACLYGLPLRLRSASTACLHHAVVIIVIVIVHFLFKRNIYFSLLYVIYFFPSSFLEIILLLFF
jgi:hypothetical protein